MTKKDLEDHLLSLQQAYREAKTDKAKSFHLNKIVIACIPLADKIVKKRCFDRTEADDMRQELLLSIEKAVNAYQPGDKGSSLFGFIAARMKFAAMYFVDLKKRHKRHTKRKFNGFMQSLDIDGNLPREDQEGDEMCAPRAPAVVIDQQAEDIETTDNEDDARVQIQQILEDAHINNLLSPLEWEVLCKIYLGTKSPTRKQVAVEVGMSYTGLKLVVNRALKKLRISANRRG